LDIGGIDVTRIFTQLRRIAGVGINIGTGIGVDLFMKIFHLGYDRHARFIKNNAVIAKRFVAGIDIFRAPAIMNASYFMNGILLTLSR